VAFGTCGGGARLARWLSPLLLAAVVVLQHRSVWIAGLVGVLVAALATRAQHASRLTQVAVLAVAVTVVALPALYGQQFSRLSREIGTSAATAVSGQGTVHARLEDWRLALGDFVRSEPRVWAFGHGYGRDTVRVVTDEHGQKRLVAFGIHNHYIGQLVTMGALGLLAFLAVVGPTAWRLYRMCLQGAGGLMPPVLLAMLMMQLAYYVPYAGDALQHFLLGTAMAYVATATRRTPHPQSAPGGPAGWPSAGGRDVAWR
jgi:O-antigen ligase